MKIRFRSHFVRMANGTLYVFDMHSCPCCGRETQNNGYRLPKGVTTAKELKAQGLIEAQTTPPYPVVVIDDVLGDTCGRDDCTTFDPAYRVMMTTILQSMAALRTVAA